MSVIEARNRLLASLMILPSGGREGLTDETSRTPQASRHATDRIVAPRWRGLLAGSARQRRADSRLLVFSGSGADDAEVAAAAHLDPLADRFRHGRARLAGALGPLRATGTALAAGGP